MGRRRKKSGTKLQHKKAVIVKPKKGSKKPSRKKASRRPAMTGRRHQDSQLRQLEREGL